MKKLGIFSRTFFVLLVVATLLAASAANVQIARGQSARGASDTIVNGTALLFASPGGPVQSGDFWVKKDYKQWNDAECKKLLTDSPWAADYPIGSLVMEPLKGNKTPSPNDLNHENNPKVDYQVQFRSALPVRQAVVRQALLKQKYDQMPPDQKKAIDAQTEPYLMSNYKDRIAVYVAYSANIKDDDLNLATYWHKQTTDILKNTVFLINDRGVRVPLSAFVVSGGGGREMEFDFPRESGGNPIVLAGDKSLKLEFVHPVIPNTNTSEKRVLIEFKPAKMVVGGTLVF